MDEIVESTGSLEAVNTRRTGQRRMAIIVVVAGCLLSIGAYVLSNNQMRRSMRAEFEAVAIDKVRGLEFSITNELDILYALRGLFMSSVRVTREEFGTFINETLQGWSKMHRLGWVPRVKASQRRLYELSAHSDGIKNFQIWESDDNGEPVPVGEREDYFPVYYVDPVNYSSVKALGFDEISVPKRSHALQTAWKTGKMAATEPITLVNRPGLARVLVFLPVFKTDLPHNTPESRRQNLIGFSLAVVNVGTLVDSAIFDLKFPPNFDVFVFDSGAEEKLLHVFPAAARTEANPVSPAEDPRLSRHYAKAFEIGGRTWTIVVRPLQMRMESFKHYQAYFVLLAGLGITAMLFIYLINSAKRSRKMTGLIDDTTKSNAVLEATMENMEQGISTFDENLNVTAFNAKFLELLDLPPDKFKMGFSLEDAFRYNAERGEYGPGDVDAQVRERVEMAKKFEPHQFERIRPDGTVIDIRGNPISTGGFVTTYSDVTEKKKVAEDLAEKEAQVATALASMSDGLFMIDKDLKLRIINEKFIEWYDLPEPTTRPGVSIRGLIKYRAERGDYGPGDPGELVEERLEGYRDRSTDRLEDRLPGGRIIEVLRTPIADGGMVVVFNDITESKKAEENGRELPQ